MVVIVNIIGQKKVRNSDQNFNLLAMINWAATIYGNDIRKISGKNCSEKPEKNCGLNSG